jgi:uncharacterized membrane protein
MAASLIVIAFETEDEAEKLREGLKSQQHSGVVGINDIAVVSKDADGKVKIHNQVSHGTMIGTGAGALLGVLLATVFFPVGAILLGAAGGALVGRLADLGVDGKFVKEVGDSMQPNTSAVFFIVRNADPSALLGLLREYKGGKLLQTNLDSETEDAIKDALGDKSPAS